MIFDQQTESGFAVMLLPNFIDRVIHCFFFEVLSRKVFMHGFTFYLCFLLLACTSEPQYIPERAKYREDTRLMLNMCQKFSIEPDADKLHKVVVAVQLARPVACTDFVGECQAYGDFLNYALSITEDHVIDSTERKQLELKLAKLKSKIAEGFDKLK